MLKGKIRTQDFTAIVMPITDELMTGDVVLSKRTNSLYVVANFTFGIVVMRPLYKDHVSEARIFTNPYNMDRQYWKVERWKYVW